MQDSSDGSIDYGYYQEVLERYNAAHETAWKLLYWSLRLSGDVECALHDENDTRFSYSQDVYDTAYNLVDQLEDASVDLLQTLRAITTLPRFLPGEASATPGEDGESYYHSHEQHERQIEDLQNAYAELMPILWQIHAALVLKDGACIEGADVLYKLCYKLYGALYEAGTSPNGAQGRG